MHKPNQTISLHHQSDRNTLGIQSYKNRLNCCKLKKNTYQTTSLLPIYIFFVWNSIAPIVVYWLLLVIDTNESSHNSQHPMRASINRTEVIWCESGNMVISCFAADQCSSAELRPTDGDKFTQVLVCYFLVCLNGREIKRWDSLICNRCANECNRMWFKVG